MQPSQPNSDEIDFLQLLANITRFLVQNWWLLVLSLGSCIALSWLSYRKAPRVFASEMMVQSKFLSETYASQVLRGLQKMIDQGADSAVASKLNLSSAEASMVRSVGVLSPFSEKVSMSEDDRTYFLITVEISDPGILPRLQPGLVHFFENLSYIKLRVTEKKKSYQDLIAKIDREIDHVESSPAATGSLNPMLSLEKWSPKQRSQGTIPNPALFDPSTMSIYMTNQRNDAREKLAMLLNGMEVIQGFVPSKNSLRPNFSVYMASGFSSGVLLFIVLLGLRSLHLLLKRYPV